MTVASLNHYQNIMFWTQKALMKRNNYIYLNLTLHSLLQGIIKHTG